MLDLCLIAYWTQKRTQRGNIHLTRASDSYLGQQSRVDAEFRIQALTLIQIITDNRNRSAGPVHANTIDSVTFIGSETIQFVAPSSYEC